LNPQFFLTKIDGKIIKIIKALYLFSAPGILQEKMTDTCSLDMNIHPISRPRNCYFCKKSGHITVLSNDILFGIKNTNCSVLRNVLCNLRDVLMKKKPCRLSRSNFSFKLGNGKKYDLVKCGNIDIDDFFIRFYFGQFDVDSIFRSVSIDLFSISVEYRTLLIENSKKILEMMKTLERRNVLIVQDKRKLQYLNELCNYIIDYFEKKTFEIVLNDEKSEMLIKIYPRTTKPNQPNKKNRKNMKNMKRKNDLIILPLFQNKIDEEILFTDLINIPSSIEKIYLEYQHPDIDKNIGIDDIHICLLSELSSDLIFCSNFEKKQYNNCRPQISIFGLTSNISVLDNIFNFIEIDSEQKIVYDNYYELDLPYGLENHRNLIIQRGKMFYFLSREKQKMNDLKINNSIHQKKKTK
jgi:hypothetical protein